MQGRIRWRRFAALMVPATAVAGAVIFGIGSGAIAASISVSGQTFKVSATRLEGDGFAQYGGVVAEKGTDKDHPGTSHPVAVSSIASASLYDLCQSVKVPGTPIVLTINAGGNNDPATATNMIIDMDKLEGDATFTEIKIGRDASDLGEAQKGSFGQSADHVQILGLRQTARYTSAGSFALKGLSLTIKTDGKECFTDVQP